MPFKYVCKLGPKHALIPTEQLTLIYCGRKLQAAFAVLVFKLYWGLMLQDKLKRVWLTGDRDVCLLQNR